MADPAERSRPIQIVCTPGSGEGRALQTARAVREALEARGHPTAFDEFDDLPSLTEWAQSAGDRLAAIVCVGGDGTQSATAVAAVRRAIPFVPVSHGFGNLFARAFGRPRTAEDVLDLLRNGRVVHSDVGMRNGELFLCHESYGLIAEVQEAVEGGAAAPRTRWQRWLSYYRAALEHLRDAPARRLRVEVDGRVVATDASLVVVANVKTYGAWLPLTPDASPVDGLFDVFVLGGSHRQVFGQLLRRHLRLPGSTGGLVCRGQRVTVVGRRETRDQLEVLPGRLPVVVSRKTARALRRDQARHGVVVPLAGRRVA